MNAGPSPTSIGRLTLSAAVVMMACASASAQEGFYGTTSIKSAMTEWQKTAPADRSLVSDYFLDCALAEPSAFYSNLAGSTIFQEWLSQLPLLSFRETSRICTDLSCMRDRLISDSSKQQVLPAFVDAHGRLIDALRHVDARRPRGTIASGSKAGYTLAGLTWYLHRLWPETGSAEQADISNALCGFVIHDPNLVLSEMKRARRLAEWISEVVELSLVDWGEPACGETPSCIRRKMIDSLIAAPRKPFIETEKAQLLKILETAAIRIVQ